MSTVILIIVSLLFLALTVLLQQRTFFIQYVFFLRFPILIGLFMVIFPFFAGEDNPKIIQNWFDIDFVGLTIATWLSILLAWAVMYAAAVLYVHVPSRNDLLFLRSEHEKKKRGEAAIQPMPNWLKRYRFPIFSVLATPIWIACWRGSVALSWLEKLSAIVMGVVLAHLFAVGTTWVRGWYTSRQQASLQTMPKPRTTRMNPKVQQALESARKTVLTDDGLSSLWKGYQQEHDDVFTRTRALSFLGLAAVMYVFGFFLVRPDQRTFLTESVPAIAYVLMLLMLLASALSVLSLLLDRYRVPVLLILCVYISWHYKAAEIDHYYKLIRANCPLASRSSGNYGVAMAYEDWAKRHPIDKYPTMVVVSASGGGITAARWTAQVLSNLQRDPNLTDFFGDSIAMISSVSGGAVGSAYVVNAYTSAGAPRDGTTWQTVEDQAGRSSLAAVGWGLVYPDFLRMLVSPPAFLVGKDHDRGWAIERRWAAGTIPDGTSIAKWRDGIRGGWRPVLIFNATVAETGERLVIAPVDIPTAKQGPADFSWRARKLLYPGDDLEVVTAARLSATFPYVTPIARPDQSDDCVDNLYHVADGGYTDNFGVLSAVDYLREIAGKIQADGRKVVLVQIRASNPETMPSPQNHPSFLSIASGPLQTLLSVRTPVQVARNDALVDYLKYEWQQKKIGQLYTVVFQLYKDNPLSWHLSPREKETITAEWLSPKNQCTLVALKTYLGVVAQAPAECSVS